MDHWITDLMDHWILVNHEPVRAGLMEWAHWLETCKEERLVYQTTLSDGCWVSTIFLGTDYSFGAGPPVLFETMIFKNRTDIYMDRYSTWGQAVEGHWCAVANHFGEDFSVDRKRKLLLLHIKG